MNALNSVHEISCAPISQRLINGKVILASLRPIAYLLGFAIVPLTTIAQTIVPDGKTVTTVTTDANGRQTVTIATPRSTAGVSYNSYSGFGVSTAGATFDNRTNTARLIINEVTGNTPSQLLGEILVDGPRANLILANPNGITVNGASFRNTGSVTLATSNVQLVEYATGAGTSQLDAILRVRGGEIEIGPKGLVGAFNNLDLVSKKLRINGLVENTFTGENGKLKLVAGDVDVQYDSSLSPVDDKSTWGQYGRATDAATSETPRIAVDISSTGSLSSGRIDVIVTDKGAGVHHAGTAKAVSGDFVVSSTGLIELHGAAIQAGGNIALIGDDLVIGAQGDTASRLKADKDVQLISKKITLNGAELSAGTEKQSGNVVLGDSEADAQRDLVISTGGTKDAVATTIRASGGIGLFAKGKRIIINGSSVESDGGMRLIGTDLLITSTRNADKFQKASLNAKYGYLDINMPGSIVLTGGEIQGGAGVYLKSPLIRGQATGTTSTDIDSAIRSNGGSVVVDSTGAISLIDTEVIARRNAIIRSDSDVLLETKRQSDDGQAKIIAAEGGLSILAGGNITNRGGLLRGADIADGEDDAATKQFAENFAPVDKRAVTIRARGNIVNESVDKKHLGIIFAEKGDIDIAASGDLINQNARIISNKHLNIDVAGAFSNVVTQTQSAPTQTNTSSSERAYVFLRRSNERRTINFGDVTIPGELSFLVANGNIAIRTQRFVNRGGDINANDGSLTIRSVETLTNQALRVGSVTYERNCLIFCRTRASGRVSLAGGNLNASRNVDIVAPDGIFLLGGGILALEDLILTSFTVRAESLETYSTLGIYRGAFSKLGGNWAAIRVADAGGVIRSVNGSVVVNGDLVLDGGVLRAAGESTVSGTRTIIREPKIDRTPAPPLGLISRIGG
jgi:filamentous hemagglutinin family protein